MKFRNACVSNSSSSSYICEICDHAESGYDLGMAEAEFISCVNDHTICEGHVLDYIMEKGFIAELKQYLIDNDEARESDVEDIDEANALIECGEIRWNLPAAFCPCCNFHSLARYDYHRYLETLTDINKQTALGILKTKFGTTKELWHWIRAGGPSGNRTKINI